MDRFTFHSDPGHGWLEVPTSLVKGLGIAGAISSFSYVSHDGGTCYLEEDCDAGIFMTEMKQRGREVQVVDLEKDSDFIRRLPRYEPRVAIVRG